MKSSRIGKKRPQVHAVSMADMTKIKGGGNGVERSPIATGNTGRQAGGNNQIVVTGIRGFSDPQSLPFDVW